MRVPYVLAGAIAVAAPTCSIGCSRYHRYQIAKAREAAALHPAQLYIPPPVPSGDPIFERDGVDADGAPLRSVDRAQVRGMLERKQYAQLTKLFEDLQRDFEATPADENLPIDAEIDLFATRTICTF